MSYILDALRRADAERRGAIAPGELTAPSVLSPEDSELPPPHRPMPWVLGGLGLAMAAGLTWCALRPDAPPEALADAPPLGLPALQPSPHPSATAPLPVAPPVAPPPGAAPSAAVSGMSAGGGIALHEPLPPSLAALANVTPAPAPGPRANPATSPATTPASAKATPPASEPVAELPDAVRRDMPPFTLGGAMYSERAADRMLIVNGQLRHEGDALGKDLVLRQIKLKAAVLEFRGQRYLVRY